LSTGRGEVLAIPAAFCNPQVLARLGKRFRKLGGKGMGGGRNLYCKTSKRERGGKSCSGKEFTLEVRNLLTGRKKSKNFLVAASGGGR